MKKGDPRSSLSGQTPVETIGITFNLKRKSPEEGEPDDRYEEYDSMETIENLRNIFEEDGFRTVLLEQNETFFENLCQGTSRFPH